MFKWLAIPLAFFIANGVAKGAVYGRSGMGGRMYVRAQEPWTFWLTIASYTALMLALIFVF